MINKDSEPGENWAICKIIATHGNLAILSTKSGFHCSVNLLDLSLKCLQTCCICLAQINKLYLSLLGLCMSNGFSK